MADNFDGSKINSPDYWNKRFLEDWIAKGGRRQTSFFAELCCRELPDWFVEEGRARKSTIFDFGCALGDALPVLQRAFPDSPVRGGDVAQVGLGLARALHPGFEFVDTSTIGDAGNVADIVYCSNTLEHFANWREILHRLSRHANEYLIVMVPFEEEDRIDEHFCMFEFDSLPARLPSGARLLHLGVCDAGLEPETQWNGLQLIAIYGKTRCSPDPASAGSLSQPREGSLLFDLRAIAPPAVPSLLAGLAAMSHAKRQLVSDLGEAHKLARAAAAARAGAARRIDELERLHAEYAQLTRGVEAAQRRLLDALTAVDPGLIGDTEISPIPDRWPADLPDGAAIHQATFARLTEALQRANRLGLAFHEQAIGWRAERAELTRRLQAERHAFENAIGERDRARGRAGALNSRTSEASLGTPAPLVSIVLPVYDQAYLVDEAIAGIISQAYEKWELIVLDDGSNDDLEQRVRQYLDETRVLFLRQPNQRLPAALNHALAYARGDLLTWTSADNIMLPNQLGRLVEELAAHPNAGLVYSDYWAIDATGGPLDDPRWRPHNRDPQIPDLARLPSEVTIENLHRSGDNFLGPSFMYRRPIAEIVGRYADDAFGGEDYDFWLRMHLVTEFRHVAEPLYKYRVHADTLTSRAEELGLFANIRESLEADRWRIETLLTDGALRSGDALLRPVSQFHAALLKRCCPVAYTTFVERGPTAAPEGPAVVDIDVPVRAINAAALHHADILLCRSDLTAALLRREDWVRDKRILTWNGEPTPAVQHAFIQAFAEQVTAPATAQRRRTLPQIDDPFRPGRILLLVDRWSSSGLENIVIDLAESLARNGRTVFVASARGAPPPKSAFASTPIRTLPFRGDESAFEGFLRREAIEVINYHDSCFAADRAKERGVATVCTMHDCHLWMDDAARAQLSRGLAEMDRVITVSRQVAQFAAAQFGLPCDRIVVVSNGLRDEIISAAAPPVGGADLVVTMVAPLTRPKLQHVAIAAFAEAAQDIPRMRLQLIGAPLDHGYHQELEAQIAASPQGHRITLSAGLTRVETIAAMAGAHVFVLPSLVEGCSTALLEAAASGCVCIASDVGGARELYVAGGPVVLVPSPLGELDRVTQRQFLEAAASDLPQHREHIAEALRIVWRDYASFAAGVPEMRTRLRDLSGMQQMTDSYLLAYTMARRGGRPPRRRLATPLALPRQPVEAAPA
jgi:glycosyltransferase involved in cell wall biosynthesis